MDKYREALADLLWRFELEMPQRIPIQMPSADAYTQLTGDQRSDFIELLMNELQGPCQDSKDSSSDSGWLVVDDCAEIS